ncbi:hypothetical protein M9Y10_009657 [Tritrichomonas musculus]|uniref:Ubiquitin-like domain-containing protein n=1 Tax=Tritrichomonas musculus TaxID=1915356 RepID=A0ABR2INY4_9EUKA
MKITISLSLPGGEREVFPLEIDSSATVSNVINQVRRSYHNTPYQSYILKLNGQNLNSTDKIISLDIDANSVFIMDYDAPGSHPPVRKQLRIPRRTDIDTDMKEPTDIQQRIETLRSLFPTGKAPDDETIKTALENSYWNLDRAVDYLLPTIDKTEDPLTQEDKDNIVKLKEINGSSAEEVIQIYFACDKKMELAQKLLAELA